MAASLGYKETISWEDIQNPYIPNGMATAFDNSTTIQSAMAALLPQMLMSMANGQTAQKENAYPADVK